MQIFVKGEAKRTVAPDQIVATVNFNEHADTYDEALKKGVELAKKYFKFIEDNTDFKASDFKTNSYNIREEFSVNHIKAETEEDLNKRLTKRVSDGFYFSQTASLEFDYNKERLAKLLTLTSKTEGAPKFYISFCLKDRKSYERGLIGDAYSDAQKKAETLAAAAGKNLRDCVRVELDAIPNSISNYSTDRGAGRMAKHADISLSNIDGQIETIDETFHPDDITIYKNINVVWETSN